MNIVNRVLERIIKIVVNWGVFLWRRKLRILLVLVLPLLLVAILILNQGGTCKITMPVREHQKDLQSCLMTMNGMNDEKAQFQEDSLQRLLPGMTERLRYDFIVKNNFQTQNGTSSLLVIRDKNGDVKKKIMLSESYTVASNLSRSEAIDKLKNYAPELEVWAGTSISGGWELKYHPDTLSIIIQLSIILIAWFQFVMIFDYVFLKITKTETRR